jgi:hypothetical protein
VTKLSTAARVVHDLGLAVCFGGTLFGKVAFNPSVRALASKPERGRVGGTTWNRFNVLNAASFGAAMLSWSYWRLGSAGEDANRRAHGLSLTKDVLTGVAASTGLVALVAQVMLNRQAPGGAVPLETGGVPAPEASEKAARLQRLVGALWSVNAALFGSLIAATTALCEEGVPSRRVGKRGRVSYSLANPEPRVPEPFKAALKAVVAAEQALDGPEGPTRCYEPSRRLLGAFRSTLV